MKHFLAFLFPLAVYFLILGLINRRRRPMLVPGPWDFGGLLFAASGFLLFGGPAILVALRERWQITSILSPRRAAQWPGIDAFNFWVMLSVLYFAVVVGGSAILLWRRRMQLAIYNIHPGVLDEALAQALDRLGLPWSRSGQQVYIGLATNPRVQKASIEGEAGRSQAATVDLIGYPARLEVDPSPLLCHVTLLFHQMNGPLRQEIESELSQVLNQVETHGNQVGLWFLALSFLLLCLTTFLALLGIILPVVING